MRNFPRKSSETTRAARSSKSYERNQRDHNEVFNESSRRNHKERGGRERSSGERAVRALV